MYLRMVNLWESPAKEIEDHFNKMGHWWRFMRYRDGDSMPGHVDSPGEIMAILYLSKRGIDYDEGALYASSPDDFEVVQSVCDQVEPGDLIFLDGHRLIHGVTDIGTSKGQLGRMTIFIPGFPFEGSKKK